MSTKAFPQPPLLTRSNCATLATSLSKDLYSVGSVPEDVLVAVVVVDAGRVDAAAGRPTADEGDVGRIDGVVGVLLGARPLVRILLLHLHLGAGNG